MTARNKHREPPPENENPGTAATVTGAKLEASTSFTYPDRRAFARYCVDPFLCVEVLS